MVNASDSGSRGRRFEPNSGQTVLCPYARHIYSQKVLVIPRKRWLRPNMTEKLFTGTLRFNQPTNQHYFLLSSFFLFSVFEPMTIRDQMVFKSLIMLKMFLSATATGKS